MHSGRWNRLRHTLAPCLFSALRGKLPSLRLARPARVGLAAAFLLSSGIAARADVSLLLNSQGVISAPTTLTVIGTVSATGDWQDLKGAQVCISYDPAKVSISNATAATGWNYEIAVDHTDTHIYQALFTTNAAQITATSVIFSFTVTPVSGPVDTSDCSVMSLRGGSGYELWPVCELVSGEFNTVWIYNTCPDQVGLYLADNYVRPPDDGGMMRMMDAGGSASLGCEDIQSVVRLLRFVGGLAPLYQLDPGNMSDPSRLAPTHTPTWAGDPAPAVTLQDQATLELVDSEYWLTEKPASPHPGYNRLDPDYRHFTIADAIAAAKIPGSGPSSALWTSAFIGNKLLPCGDAANAVGMPAIADIDAPGTTGSGVPDVVIPMGTINGNNYPNPTALDIKDPVSPHAPYKSSNPNNVYAFSFQSGVFDVKSGWPRPLRDAPTGVVLADFLPTPGLEVIATNFQDGYTHTGQPYGHLYARPYVWDATAQGTSIFADSLDPDRGSDLSNSGAGYPPDSTHPAGVVSGHISTACPVLDVDGNGSKEILVPGIGYYDVPQSTSFFSTIQAVEPDGTKLFETQHTSPSSLWYTGPAGTASTDVADTAFDAPPVWMRTAPSNPSAPRYIVAGAESGLLYAWKTDSANRGQMVSGFPAQTDVAPSLFNARATLSGSIACADVDGDGHTEIVAGTGRSFYYYTDNPYYQFLDGAIYCWGDTGGTPKWRYPATGWLPAFGSGVAVGRLQGGTQPYVVAVDASGTVVALDGTDGSVLWSYDLEPIPTGDPGDPWTKTTHRYFQGTAVSPLILDVNGDGYQDVIIGTTHGEIYILNGQTGAEMWREHTFRSSDSLWTPDVLNVDTYTQEMQFEEVRGLAVAPLDPDQPTHAILAVTCSRAGLTIPVQQIGGHVLLFDLSTVLGRSQTWYANDADWTQFQQNAQRTGSYPGP